MLKNPYTARLFRFCPYYYSSKTRLTKNLSDSYYPLLRILQHVSRHIMRRVDSHCAELQKVEICFIYFHPFLLEQHRTGRGCYNNFCTYISS